MEKQFLPEENDSSLNKTLNNPLKRRGFLKFAGATVAVSALVLAGCDKDDDDGATDQGVNLGSGDVGILNYAYALEQLEAAFYIQVINQKYSGMTGAEQTFFTEIRDHEVAHREFFKAALGTNAIPALEVDFSSINFTSKTSVLNTAKAFEDLGVSAYNGAGKLLTDVNNLLIAGKIVSVEARHAAAIRDMINPKSADFAGDDVVTVANGLDVARTPDEVLAIAGTYLKTKLNASNLPK